MVLIGAPSYFPAQARAIMRTFTLESRSERNRDAAFDRLAGNGAELVTTEMVAFEWLGSAEHPAFKEIQGLIK